MPENDFMKTINDLKDKIDHLNKAESFFKDKINTLEKQKKSAEQMAIKSEAKASEAAKKVAVITTKYNKAKEFQDGEYRELIKELFEVPQKKLVGEIKNQSKKSLTVAFFSIVITIIIAMIFQYINFNENKNLKVDLHSFNKQFQDKIESLELNLDNLDHSLGNVYSNLKIVTKTDRNMQIIIEHINKFQNEFGVIKSRNDIRLLYKMQLSKQLYDYSLYTRAMREAGISVDLIPKTIQDYWIWDTQLLGLYKRWLSKLMESLDEETLVDNTNLYYKNFKDPNDATDYKKIKLNQTTCGELCKELRNKIDKINQQLRNNRQT